MVGGSIGERLYEAKVYFQMTDLLAWTVVIVVCSVGFEKLVLWLLRRGFAAWEGLKMDLVISHVYKDFGRGPVLRDVSLTVRQGETVCLMGPSGLGKPPCCGAWPGWSGRKAAPSPVFRRGLAMCSRRTGCAASFPPWPTSAWQQAGPCRRSSVRGAGPGRQCPAAGVAAVRRDAPPVAIARRAPGRSFAAGRGLQGPDDQCRRDTVACIRRRQRRGVPAVRHPRPGGGRPAGGRCLDLSAL